jgi:hypothetical protein
LDFPEYASEISDYIKQHLTERFAAYGISLEDFQFAHLAPNEDDPVVKELYNNRLEAVKERERRSIQGISYQQERQFDILETAAGNEGGTGSAMMGAGIGAGMGFGMAGAFGQQMNQAAQQMTAPTTLPPPPMGFSPYYVYVNNAQQGPFDMNTLQTLANNGVLTPQTFVWKQGMSTWAVANLQPDLVHLFSATPPPPPVIP